MIVFSDFKKWIAFSQYSISQTVPQIIYPQYPIWPCPYHGRTKWSSDMSRWQILVRWCNRVTRVVPIFCMFCKEKLPRTAQDCKSTPNKTLYITCGQFFSYFFLRQKKKISWTLKIHPCWRIYLSFFHHSFSIKPFWR